MANEDPRVAVIGGGAVGTSTLFHLTERGITDAILFEKGQLGSGSTSKAAGGVRNMFTNELNIELGNHNIDFFANFEKRVGREIEFRQTGYVYLYHTEEVKREWRERQTFFESHDVAADLLSPSEVVDLFSALDDSSIKGALFGPECGHVDPSMVTHAFAGAAVDQGATVETKTEVTDVRLDDGAVSAIETVDGMYDVDFVVNAAGPWAGRVGRLTGLDLPLSTMVRRIMVTSPTETANSPLFIDSELGCYFAAEKNGSILACDMAQDEHGIDDPDSVQRGDIGYGYYLDASEKIERLVPAIADLDVINGWAGIQTHTPDGHAIVGRSQVDGFLLACGFSGHGVQQAPSVGEALADLVVDGETRLFNIDSLSLDRFESDVRIEPEGMA